MTAFVLIPGAGGVAWYWHRVVPVLQGAKYEAVAVDLPGDDEHAGLETYADLVVRAAAKLPRVILVAQSLGGFTAPLVCARRKIEMLVFVNAMIPLPTETPAAWGRNTGSSEARIQAAKRGGYGADFDLDTYFFHDVPEDVVRAGAAHERSEADRIFTDPCRFEAWPNVPMHVLVGKDDRLFPMEFQERIARERLHEDIEPLDGGHLVALSNPQGVVDRLLAYAQELDGTP